MAGEIEEQEERPHVVMTDLSASRDPESQAPLRGRGAVMTTASQRRQQQQQGKGKGKKATSTSVFDAFQNPFALLSRKTTRNITSSLGHVDGRSLRRDDSSDLKSPTNLEESNYQSPRTDWDGLESSHLASADMKRTTSFLNNNPRIHQSMDAFLVENQSSSVKIAARSVRQLSDGSSTGLGKGQMKPKHKKVIKKYIGLVPTAPVRDQPVGSGTGDGVNLRFRYKLSNLKRKVINERDGNSKIVRFNESRMAKFGWLGVMQGTVFSKPSAPFIWYQSLSLLFLSWLSFAVCYLSAMYAPSVVSWQDFEHDNLVEVWEVLDEFKVVADTSQVLTTLVSFLLGLYVTKTVDIWWNIRHELLQGVLNTIDSMCARLAVYFPGNTKEDDEAKEIILRYGVLSVKLLFKDAKEVDSWNIDDRKRLGCDNLGDLVDEGLLLPHEKELLKDCPSRAQVVWVWIASLFTKWCLDGRLPSPLENQNTILEECNTARNNIAMILARVNTQYPMSYSHLVISMVKVLLIIQAVVAGYIFSLAVYTSYYYWMATQLVYLIVWTIFHQAMIDIKEHITNPFRDNPTDFSEMIQAARAINTNRAFFNAGKHPPYAHKTKTNPAALPPQLIVRQIISSRLKKRTAQTSGLSPVGTPGGMRVNPERHADPMSPGNSGKFLDGPSPRQRTSAAPSPRTTDDLLRTPNKNTYL